MPAIYHVASYLLEQDAAAACGDFLVKMIDDQPNKNKFYLKRDLKGEIIVEINWKGQWADCIVEGGDGWEGFSGSFSRLFGQHNAEILKGDIVLWHSIGDWFEVIQ